MFGNFGMGMYFGNAKASESIDNKLKDPKTEIEDLLRDEDLLQEFRSQNEKLIEYFDRNKIKRLIDYIIKEPEVDEQERGYKFPFISSQIFGLELDKMIDHFFVTNKQLEEENKKNEKKEEKNEANDENPKDKETSGESAKKEVNKEESPEQKEKKNDMDANKNKNEEDKKEEAGKIKEGESKEGEKKEEGDKAIKDGEKKEEEEKANKDGPKDEEKKGEEKKKIEGESKEAEKKEEVNKENKNETNDGNKNEGEKKVNAGDTKEENKNGEKNDKEGENKEENSQKEKPEENRMELLDHLFSFLPEKEEKEKRLNYVLCGYFSSIFSNLLSINPTALLKYIYNVRSDIFYKMVNHCYRKSISDTLSRILHFENYFQSEDSLDKDSRHNMEEKRKEILSKIFQKININMDNEDLNSIYFLITGLFDQAIEEEKLILKSIIDDSGNMEALLTKQLVNLDLAKNDENVENKRKNFMIIIDIVTFLLNSAKKLKLELPTYASDSITHTKLSKEIFDNLGGIIKNIFNKKIEDNKTILQSFNKYQLTPLGEFKIKIVDLLSHIIPYCKNISKLFDNILIENEFFTNAFNYLYEYEWNNIYQESLLSLLKSIINDADSHELIQEYLFNKLNLIEIIKTHTNSEDKYKFNSKNESNPISHGYYSFFISLSYKLNTALGGTPVALKNNSKTRQGSFSFTAKPPEDAMSSLYGHFGEDENNGNEAEKEEEKYNYETMKKYINDDWRLLFENISEVIKQYENRDWPEEEKKDEESPFGGLPGQKEEEDNPSENNEASDGEKNIMKGDNNNVNVNANDENKKEAGEQGNNNNGEDSSSKNAITDGKNSGGNNNEKKEENKQKVNEPENKGVVQGNETVKDVDKSKEKTGDAKDEGKKEEKKENDGNKKDEEKKEENKDGDTKKEAEKSK